MELLWSGRINNICSRAGIFPKTSQKVLHLRVLQVCNLPKLFKTALGLSEGGFCICTKIKEVKLVFLWKVCYNLIKITPPCSGNIGGYYEELFGIIMV